MLGVNTPVEATEVKKSTRMGQTENHIGQQLSDKGCLWDVKMQDADSL